MLFARRRRRRLTDGAVAWPSLGTWSVRGTAHPESGHPPRIWTPGFSIAPVPTWASGLCTNLLERIWRICGESGHSDSRFAVPTQIESGHPTFRRRVSRIWTPDSPFRVSGIWNIRCVPNQQFEPGHSRLPPKIPGDRLDLNSDARFSTRTELLKTAREAWFTVAVRRTMNVCVCFSSRERHSFLSCGTFIRGDTFR
jgi:hypothetical protein